METFKTSEIYEKLDLLYRTLTTVVPSFTSPLASCYLLKGMLYETSFIYKLICALQEQWRELLPFEEDDSKDVKWVEWAEKLSPDKIVDFIPSFPLAEPDPLSVSDEDKLVMSTRGDVLKDLYQELDKLSAALLVLDTIVKAAEPESIERLYNDLRTRCEYIGFHKNRDLSNIPLYNLNDYKKHLLSSVFKELMKEDREDEKQGKWKKMTNGYGVPDVLRVGRYIYSHRFELKLHNLVSYFRYERVAVFMFQSYNKELNENSPSFQITDIVNSGINKDKLKQVIKTKFIPKFRPKNRWICAWRVLKDTHILIDVATMEHFTQLMASWFPKDFGKDDIKYYKDTCLSKIPREQWSEQEYLEDRKTHRKASRRAFGEFNVLCSELEDFLRTENLGIF